VAAYMGYYLIEGAVSRSWWYYVVCGVLVMMLARGARVATTPIAGAWGCWLAEIESAQQTVCGIAQWGQPEHADLCQQWLGRDIYRGLAAAAVTTAIVLWPRAKA